MLENPPKTTNAGRKAARDKEAKGQDFARQIDINRGSCKTPAQDLVEVMNQTVTQNQAKIVQNNRGALLVSLNSRANCIQKDLDRAFELAKIRNDWSNYDKLEKEKEKINEQIEEIEAGIRKGIEHSHSDCSTISS